MPPLKPLLLIVQQNMLKLVVRSVSSAPEAAKLCYFKCTEHDGKIPVQIAGKNTVFWGTIKSDGL